MKNITNEDSREEALKIIDEIQKIVIDKKDKFKAAPFTFAMIAVANSAIQAFLSMMSKASAEDIKNRELQYLNTAKLMKDAHEALQKLLNAFGLVQDE